MRNDLNRLRRIGFDPNWTKPKGTSPQAEVVPDFTTPQEKPVVHIDPERMERKFFCDFPDCERTFIGAHHLARHKSATHGITDTTPSPKQATNQEDDMIALAEMIVGGPITLSTKSLRAFNAFKTACDQLIKACQ